MTDAQKKNLSRATEGRKRSWSLSFDCLFPMSRMLGKEQRIDGFTRP